MSIKDIYFSNSHINLKKKVYLQRRYEIPSDTGIVYQQYSAIVANRWTIYNSASGITISDGKISFTDTSVGGGIVGSFSVTQNQIDLIKVEIEIDSYVSGTLLIKFYDTLDTAPVRFLRDFNRQNRWFAVIVMPSLVSDGRFVIYSNDGFTGKITHGGAKEAKLYEDNWVDISQYLIDKSFSTSQVLDAKSWEFGEVQQDNMKLSFINVNGELSDESNVNSFFANRFIKHQSKVKVGIVLNDEETTMFEGLVDERACSSDTQGPALIKEKLVVFSYMKLFSNLTISALGNATTTLMTTIQSAINYIIDYGYFKYFVPQAIINVANDAYIDISQYSGDTKLSEVLQDLAKGQSAFWIDYNNTFHFSPVFSSSNNIYDFGLSPERKIKIFDYSAGADGVIENFYWEKVNNINYIAKKQKYSTSETINIKSITSPVTRQNIINICGENFSRKRITCKLEIPLCPFIEILDEIKVSNVKDINTENVGVAKFIDKIFIVNGIKHSNNITTLHLIEKKWNFKVFNNLFTGKDDLPLEVIFDDYPQHQGEYIITLSAEQGCSDGSYINQATGATIKVKVILTSTDKIKIVKIKGGNLGDSHGGCGLALYVNGVMLAIAGGGSCNENNNLGFGGGGYYAGKGHDVDGYDYLGTRTYINTSSSGIAVGGKNIGDNISYGGLGFKNDNEDWGEISYAYINGSDYGSTGNVGAGSVILEFLHSVNRITMEYETLDGEKGLVRFDSYVEMKTYIDSRFASIYGTSLKTVTVSGAPADLTVPDSCANLFSEHHTQAWTGGHAEPMTVNWFADVSNVVDMSAMFNGGIKQLNLMSFKSSNCENMKLTFALRPPSDVSQQIAGLYLVDTSKVTTMESMFAGIKVSSLDLSNFDTSKVTTMESMFEGIEATAINLRGWNTSNVTNMSRMFSNLLNMTALNLQWFNTKKVKDMSHMFQGSWRLQSLNLKGFDTVALEDCFAMFDLCEALITIYVGLNQFNISNIISSTYMFRDCRNIRGAISYDANKTDANYANYTTGYFTLLE